MEKQREGEQDVEAMAVLLPPRRCSSPCTDRLSLSSIRVLRHDSEEAEPRMMQLSRKTCDWAIWQQIGNNIGDVNPMRLQCKPVQAES